MKYEIIRSNGMEVLGVVEAEWPELSSQLGRGFIAKKYKGDATLSLLSDLINKDPFNDAPIQPVQEPITTENPIIATGLGIVEEDIDPETSFVRRIKMREMNPEFVICCIIFRLMHISGIAVEWARTNMKGKYKLTRDQDDTLCSFSQVCTFPSEWERHVNEEWDELLALKNGVYSQIRPRKHSCISQTNLLEVWAWNTKIECPRWLLDNFQVNLTEKEINAAMWREKLKDKTENKVRDITLKQKTFNIKLTNNQPGPVFATQYTRVVVGQRGAYIEFTRDMIIKGLVECEPGQEYRLGLTPATEKYKKLVFYKWLRTILGHRKVYVQYKKVDYADYLVGHVYVAETDLCYEGELYKEYSNKPLD